MFKNTIFAIVLIACTSSSGFAQTPAQLAAAGFVRSGNGAVLFVPGPTVPFCDIYVGEPVSYPARMFGEGPQQTPTKVLIGKTEVNPGAKGCWIMPSPKGQRFLRLAWVPAFLPKDGIPSFGRPDGEPLISEEGEELPCFQLPKKADGTWVTKYTFSAFTSEIVRKPSLQTVLFKILKADREKLDKKELPVIKKDN